MDYKTLYISFINEDIRPGYSKKIHSQTKSLSVINGQASLVIMSNSGIRIYEYTCGKKTNDNEIALFGRVSNNEGDTNKTIDVSKRSRTVLEEFKAFNAFSKIVEEMCKNESVKYVYIRRIVPISRRLLVLIKRIEKTGAFVIYEYPTFPWRDEMKKEAKGLVRKALFLLDCMHYKSLIKLPDIITYLGSYDGEDRRFFQIQNCGDADDYCVLEKNNNRSINMIGVAYVKPIHGFDLVIEALNEYYRTNRDTEVNFHIVGDTSNCPELRELTQKYHLEKHVIFHGFMTGKELDSVFQKCDIGVNALRLDEKTCYRTGITTLKTVEYTLRGLPQISGAPFTIDRNKTDTPDFLKIVKRKFSIQDVLYFYNGLDNNPERIRQYGVDHMSWNVVFGDLFNYIKESFGDFDESKKGVNV